MINELLLIGFLPQAWQNVNVEDPCHDYLMLNCYHMIENPARKRPSIIPKWLWLYTYQQWYKQKINKLIRKDMGESSFNTAEQGLKKLGMMKGGN